MSVSEAILDVVAQMEADATALAKESPHGFGPLAADKIRSRVRELKLIARLADSVARPAGPVLGPGFVKLPAGDDHSPVLAPDRSTFSHVVPPADLQNALDREKREAAEREDFAERHEPALVEVEGGPHGTTLDGVGVVTFPIDSRMPVGGRTLIADYVYVLVARGSERVLVYSEEETAKYHRERAERK